MLIKNVTIKHFKGIERVTVSGCGIVNILVGKNNSGKSTLLHAIDMAGLAINVGNWNTFQPKLAVKDMFWDAGSFVINFDFEDGRKIEIKNNDTNRESPEITPHVIPTDLKQKTLLIQSDLSGGLISREHKTPQNIMNQIQNRNFTAINSLDILFAIKYYSSRNEKNLTIETYNDLIGEVQKYFPELSSIESGRTEVDVATLSYVEFGKKLDILYSGSGLKHFIDILVKITITGAKIVLLDEPEAGLHPDLQRRFFSYIIKLAQDKNIQFFISTHSHVAFNLSEDINFFRVLNINGVREVHAIDSTTRHTLLGDFGIRPSDVFNSDICLMVEGATDVIYFEHILRTLYKSEFEPISISVIQFGGGAAHGIVSGAIDVKNIIPAKKYTYWIHDRDEKPTSPPSTEATKFKNQIEKSGLIIHIWKKREIEYYLPVTLISAAQQGDTVKDEAAQQILNGDQALKFRVAAESHNIVVPQGVFLKRLLRDHLTSKDQLDDEIKEIINKLLSWKLEITG
ncbi:MAG: AAA family ATPase [Bacteriovorax sp.]|jgi:predicted ATP-dependent endonuclease of OLD family